MRQHDLLNYTGSLMSNVKTLARDKSTYDHLAAYILSNYEGVFITRNDPDGFDSDFVETIGRVAALHDIGKVAIPELIKLPKNYNRDQRLKMQMHTIFGAGIIETMMTYSEKEDPRMLMARNIALHHHQTFNGKGYPRVKINGTIQAPLYKDYAEYLNNAPLSETEIPTEALIVGLADRYDALRSRRPYKEAYSHEKTLAVMTNDDRSEIRGCDWYGPEIWGVFEKHHLHFKGVFEHMQN